MTRSGQSFTFLFEYLRAFNKSIVKNTATYDPMTVLYDYDPMIVLYDFHLVSIIWKNYQRYSLQHIL